MLVLLHFELIVLVLVDSLVQLDLLMFQGRNIIVFVLNQIVQPVDLLSHQGNLVLLVFELNLDIFELVQTAFHSVQLDTAIIGLLLLTTDYVVKTLVIFGHGLAAVLELTATVFHTSETPVLVLELVYDKVELLYIFDLVVKLVLKHPAVLLDQSHLRQGVLQLIILTFPTLNFFLSRLQDTIDPVILSFGHIKFVLILSHIVLQVAEMCQLSLS